VYTSTGEVALRVATPVLTPLSDVGLLYPEPEDVSGKKDIVMAGLAAVDPSKDTSGSTRDININLSPSSKSKSADVINAGMAAVVPVSLSSTPSSWFTSTELYVAANGKALSPESNHAERAIEP
jgi:hypothetical protein